MPSTLRLSKIIALGMAVLLAMSVWTLFFPQLSYADGGPNATDSGYAETLLGSGEDTSSRSSNGLGELTAPWGEEIITDTAGYDPPDSDGEGIVDAFQDIVYSFGAWVIFLGVLFAASRFVGRALLEMSMRQNGSNIEGMPGFFKTGDERKGSKAGTEWVMPMIKETFIYLGIGIFVFIILSVLLGFVMWGLESLAADAPV